jgi:gas vesicle protein
MTMSDNPEEIRRDIERTRRELSNDVDALTEKVSPTKVMERRVERARGAVSNVKEKVMGSSSESGGALSGAPDKISGAASTVADTASSAPQMARRQAQGNPLAAGVIAFGAGWLLSSLLPASEKEKQAAAAVKDKASEHSDKLTGPLSEAAQQAKENLREPAQQAAESVKSTATDSVSTVKDQTQSAAADVSGQAQQSKEKVAGHAGAGGNGESRPGSTYNS